MKKLRVQSVERHRFDIDGEGITTLVILANCPLSCEYCLNKKLMKKARIVEKEPSDLLEKIMIDYCYFVATNGGVTFGGGEPLLQAKAIKEFYNAMPKNISLNIETSLNVPTELLELIVDDTKFLLIDIKSMNKDIYEKYTNITNDNVIKNLYFLKERNLQDKCRIRIPNIPNYTTKEDIEQSRKIIEEMGFQDIDVFDYILKEDEE